MKKGIKILVMALVIIMVLSVGSTAFAAFYTYTGSCSSYFDTNTYTSGYTAGRKLENRNEYAKLNSTSGPLVNFNSHIYVNGTLYSGYQKSSGTTHTTTTSASGQSSFCRIGNINVGKTFARGVWEVA